MYLSRKTLVTIPLSSSPEESEAEPPDRALASSSALN